MDDYCLYMEVKDSKEADFFRLYISNQKRIYNYILLMVPSIMDAEDILQETLTTLWSKFDEFEKGSNFAAWSRQIAHFKVLSYYHNKKHNAVFRFDQAMLERIGSYQSELMEKEDNRLFALRKCIQKLDEQDRVVVHMRYVEDKSLKEIAHTVNRTVNAVYKQFSKVHEFLIVCVRSRVSREQA
jgi:RNA polymerase sigma-70 factor, ECF subfamily